MSGWSKAYQVYSCHYVKSFWKHGLGWPHSTLRMPFALWWQPLKFWLMQRVDLPMIGIRCRSQRLPRTRNGNGRRKRPRCRLRSRLRWRPRHPKRGRRLHLAKSNMPRKTWPMTTTSFFTSLFTLQRKRQRISWLDAVKKCFLDSPLCWMMTSVAGNPRLPGWPSHGRQRKRGWINKRPSCPALFEEFVDTSGDLKFQMITLTTGLALALTIFSFVPKSCETWMLPLIFISAWPGCGNMFVPTWRMARVPCLFAGDYRFHWWWATKC